MGIEPRFRVETLTIADVRRLLQKQEPHLFKLHRTEMSLFMWTGPLKKCILSRYQEPELVEVSSQMGIAKMHDHSGYLL